MSITVKFGRPGSGQGHGGVRVRVRVGVKETEIQEKKSEGHESRVAPRDHRVSQLLRG